ncbi:hypothetical protein MXL46_15190 [Heyndrickxia sporothermodurans]|uniref:Uncharacterized protein n=2 Tax=Bacillaceae TaxID=186817 RepID=A0A150LH69_9BACI|nr:hypothetical protein [Heyndrickxia sporothermodurans]KYD11667.1 hypothetical protein B4102_2107 [Heyndrickxia sporothermodurans]MBL5771742.1 hypothetical protein [Heyndrickxia sporothermodurans]MBL5775354.1 hypothetical protein [Heyndrickxia sporothermodurans]MBL5778594.1 hypothetical protein [Heyndrickxia sporothermodurans]MBL5782183.1 hypothetical protein [Heyndrickxia sporothermodurans]
MIEGIILLIALCIFELILANIALKDKKEHLMDFYEFFDISKKDGL